MARVPTISQIQYMKEHQGDDLSTEIIATNAICLVAAYTGVVLRLISRRIQRTYMSYDDWTIVTALFIYTALLVDASLATRVGLGKHIILVTNPRILAIYNIVYESLYCATMACIKISLLCFYRRIFPQPWFRKALFAIGATILAWFFATFFSGIFQCVPMAKIWDPTMSGYCINYGRMLIATGIVNIVQDFIILALPMPLVWKIQVSSTKRWLLTATFVLGGCACIVSIVRLFFVEQVGASADPSWDIVKSGLLSTIELCIGILAANMATWRPLLNRVLGRSSTGDSSAGSASRKYDIKYILPQRDWSCQRMEQLKIAGREQGVERVCSEEEDLERLYVSRT